MNPTTQVSILKSLVTTKEILKQFVDRSDFQGQLELAFGDEFDANIALGIAASIKADDFSQILPTTELEINNFALDLSDDESLDRDSSNSDPIVNLLLQEVGRKFDFLLTATVDSSETFAAIVQGTAQSAAVEQLPAADDTSSKIGVQQAIARPIWYNPDFNPESDITTDDTNPVSESVVSEIEQPFQTLPAIWYNPDLDSNTQDIVGYDESYIVIDYAAPIVESEVVAIDGEESVVFTKPLWYDPEANISVPKDEFYTPLEYENPVVESEVGSIESEQPVVIGKPFFYDPQADLSTQDPVAYDESFIATDLVFDNVIIDIDGGQTLQILPAIWYNPDLDSNTQDTVVDEESYTTIEYGNPIVDSEVTVIEGEQPVVIGKPFFYDPQADIRTDDTIPEDGSYIATESYPIVGGVDSIPPEKPVQMISAIWYNPELDSNTQDIVGYDEPYAVIDRAAPIVESEVIAIDGEEPVVFTKPLWYDPKADISTDDTVPNEESYTSIAYPVVYEESYTGEIAPDDLSYSDPIEGTSTTRVMQGSNIEGIDVPKFDESDSTFTDEDLNVSQDFCCVLPVFDLEYIIDDSGYTGGTKFVFGAEDISMNTAQALLLATPITLEFTTGVDKLLLSQSTFSSIYTNDDGGISSFANVADDSLVDMNDAEIVYSQSTGKLFYNQNGSQIGLGDGGGQFATLSGSSALTAGDFDVLLDLATC